MLTKNRSAKFKAVDGKSGTFSAVVAVYGNVDSVGDRIVEGAFDKSLKAWQALGDPIPIVLAHEWKDPFAHIGYAMPDKVKSVPGVGLVVEEGHLDMDNPTAAQVHRLMSRKTLKEFSFGYGVPQGGQTKASDGAMDLRMLDLIEFGPCLKGVNDKTELLSIKAQLADEVADDEFVQVIMHIKADTLGNKGLSAGRARWRSQKRDPHTGKWIDETHGAGFDGASRKVNPNFGAHLIDDRRKEYNASTTLSGRDKSEINALLNEAEDAFLSGDNTTGEARVREAAVVQRNGDHAARVAANRATEAANSVPDKPASEYPLSLAGNDALMQRRREIDHELATAGPKENAQNYASLTAERDSIQKELSSKKRSPAALASEDSGDNATPEEEKQFSAQLDAAEKMLNDPNADSNAIDDAFGNLHVDNEQANFSPATQDRYDALEKRWLDQEPTQRNQLESLGNQLATMDTADQDTSEFTSQLSDALTHNMLGGDMYNPDGWQSMLELENTPGVKKLLKDPEIAAAWNDVKKYGQDQGWSDWKDTSGPYVPDVVVPLQEHEKDNIAHIGTGGSMEVRPGVKVSRDANGYSVEKMDGSGRGYTADRRGAEIMVEHFTRKPGDSAGHDYHDLGPGPGPGQSMAESVHQMKFPAGNIDRRHTAEDAQDVIADGRSVEETAQAVNIIHPDSKDHDDMEVQAQADEIGEPVQNPFSGRWALPDREGELPSNIRNADIPVTKQDIEDLKPALVDALKEVLKTVELKYLDESWQEIAKEYGLGDGQKSEGYGRHLSLDEQISTMQSDSAILTAEAQLENKGMKVRLTEQDARADETLRRLAELEAEAGI